MMRSAISLASYNSLPHYAKSFIPGYWLGFFSVVSALIASLVLPKLKDTSAGGLIIGSPVYFRNASSVCMSFLERLAVLRKPKLLLADKAVGILSVGA